MKLRNNQKNKKIGLELLTNSSLSIGSNKKQDYLTRV